MYRKQPIPKFTGLKQREKGKKYQLGNNVLIFAAQANTSLLTGVACDVISGSFILTLAVPWGRQNCPKTFHWHQMPLFKKCFSKVHFPAAACPGRVDKACVRFFVTAQSGWQPAGAAGSIKHSPNGTKGNCCSGEAAAFTWEYLLLPRDPDSPSYHR